MPKHKNRKDVRIGRLKIKHWRHWRYKNTLLLLASLLLIFLLSKTPALDEFIKSIGNLGYFGALVTGIFFVSTFTVVPASIVLFHLAEYLHPLEVAILAGFGAMLGDYILYRFIKDRLFEELRPVFKKFGRPYMGILFKSPYFAWVLPIFGAFIIASPFPDEMGVGMLGLSKIKQWQFFLLALVLNTIGIFLVVSAAQIF
jgi:hypothetical protein